MFLPFYNYYMIVIKNLDDARLASLSNFYKSHKGDKGEGGPEKNV